MASGLVTRISLGVAGLVHLLPLSGLVGPAQFETLYGITVEDPNLDILLRHRAVLFGILGVFLFASIPRPTWQVPVILAGLVSTTSFVVIATLIGGTNEAIRTVTATDGVAILALGLALALRPRSQTPEWQAAF